MPKLPAPPLPKPLRPKPKRPGENGNGPPTPAEAAQEAGITVVDWLDERTSLSGGIRWMLFRKVPPGVNWYYTLGSATMFAFLSQAVTGVFLAMYYVPSVNGGAEIPSLATRYRWKPISAAISPGISIMWIA